MEEGKFSKIKPAMTYGILIAMALIFLNLLSWIFSLEGSGWFQYLNWAVLIAVLYYALKNYRDQHLGGSISYGKAVKTGVLFFFFASIIFGFYMVIYYAYIDPEAIERSLDALEEYYYTRGMSEQQIETTMSWAEKMRSPGIQTFSAILGASFLGLILSLIVGLLVKKKGDPFSDAMRNINNESIA